MTLKDKCLLLTFYFILALSIIAPIANSRYLPTGDYIAHASSILDAGEAIKEHQLILRVAPQWGHGWRYPLFQFYGSIPYTAAGILAAATHLNSWVIFKICVIIALCIAGMTFYRLANYLLSSPGAAFLASILYMLAPYLIININVRGDFTETIAQCLLPLALYTSLKIYEKVSMASVLKAAIAWYLIAGSHLITFAYSAVFYLLLLTIKYIYDRQAIKGLLLNYLAVAFAFVLAAWFLVPALMFHKIMFINQDIVNPIFFAFLTPLPNLLGLSSISPIPLPAGGELTTPLLYPVIGVPIMAGAIMAAYIHFNDKKEIRKFPFLVPLLITFILAVFAVWSPFNFWKILPSFMVFLQFSYRLLTQVSWLGCILAAYSISWLFKDMNVRQIAGCVLIIIALSTCLFHTQSAGRDKSITAARDYANSNRLADYMIMPQTQKNIIKVNHIFDKCQTHHGVVECEIKAKDKTSITLPLLYYPNMLSVTANSERINYYPANYKGYTVTTINLNKGDYAIRAHFTGLEPANYLSLLSWLFTLCYLLINRVIKQPE